MVGYGLIGKNLGHSYSARYLNEIFKENGIDAEYNLYPIDDISHIKRLIETHKELRGLNVTIPYKSSVIPLLDHISKDAETIGAVNVIKIRRQEVFSEDGGNYVLTGYNTDWKAFSESIKPLLSDDKKSALILGTGGSSKAVGYALGLAGISSIFVSREAEKKNKCIINYDDLTPEFLSKHFLIINTTPSGMFPDVNSAPPIPYEALTPDHLCYDLIYNPEMTEFMKRSLQKGATVKNGLEMLYRQADLSLEIWEKAE